MSDERAKLKSSSILEIVNIDQCGFIGVVKKRRKSREERLIEKKWRIGSEMQHHIVRTILHLRISISIANIKYHAAD